MNDRLHPSARATLFAGLAHSAAQHFALLLFGAALRLAGHAAARLGGVQPALERFPCLGGYLDQLAGLGLDGVPFPQAQALWSEGLADWTAAAPHPLALVRLAQGAALDPEDLVVLAAVGLPEEDPRLGEVFAALAGEHAMGAPLAGMLWPVQAGYDARAALARLDALGLVARPPEAATWRPQTELWPLVRAGDAAGSLPWLPHRAAEAAPALDSLLLPQPVRSAAQATAAALAAGTVDTVAIRGPARNGRHSLAAAILRESGRGTLRADGLADANDPRWRTAAVAAAMLDAAIVVAGDPPPSEAFHLPALPRGLATLVAVLGPCGHLAGPRADGCATLALPLPQRGLREQLWREQPGVDAAAAAELAHPRLGAGAIVRAARHAQAAAPGEPVGVPSVRAALRGEEAGLSALARRIELGDPPPLALPASTAEDLQLLAARCRQRERLGEQAGPAFAGMGCGVRALFKGPSGTGKTLAARHLAATLGMELYRVDLSAVVNKYIGETEKNLERVFAQAEARDVVLLLDEGDALLTQRTAVGNANDRYANLETNYLLQRLESYDGVLVVTTNAADRIDGAFLRRLDVVIDFPAPEVAERWALWQMHLPPLHAVDPARLQAVAQRCVLSGGQVRNVALHATLLALEAGRSLDASHLEAALEREYRKQGGASPMRPRGS